MKIRRFEGTLRPWRPGKEPPVEPPAPLARCAWCDVEVPADRPGRRGVRVFCGQDHRRRFFTLARRLGAEHLDQAEECARNYRINDGEAVHEGGSTDE